MSANNPFTKRRMAVAGCIFFSMLILLSGGLLLRDHLEQKTADQNFQDLRMQLSSVLPQAAGEASFPAAADRPQTPRQVYGDLISQNPDMAGWIRIEGTAIDYPVMQTPLDPNYYLNHGFHKKHSSFGVPYADASCDLSAGGGNVIVYGHHTKGKGMFGALTSYEEESYYREHPVIQFDTLDQFGRYQIVMVSKINVAVGDSDAFDYTRSASFANQQEYEEFQNACKKGALYETGETAQFGDRLLILSTCEYSREDGRLLIVAKQLNAQDVR
ncbi:class B sortase [Clostridium minihomine]|uniref:class B sortase n=1 Tax=Clostridium minihomine TaxID=2045012 RepID=UPI000C7865A4|nr:class B sortase [Clostridium minihomine]